MFTTPHSPIARSEDIRPYLLPAAIPGQPISDDETIAAAMRILSARMSTNGIQFDSPSAVKNMCCLKLGELEHEEFAVLFMTTQHRLIAFEVMFRGTLSQASVYPREVVKRALALNAGAVVFTHNHPSGSVEPSRADEFLTQSLKSALSLVDVRVIDHVVVAGASALSFAERGLL